MLDIRESWDEWITKHPGLKHAGGIPPADKLAQEAHAKGWMDGQAKERAESDMFEGALKASRERVKELERDLLDMRAQYRPQVYAGDEEKHLWERVDQIHIEVTRRENGSQHKS